ncbi:FKBP-type peptidyl-prolyl cis-trans isomerase [Actinomadura sp. ATCC 31491]|uniref:Peptidyl-prolyl cis-trans isomerase n=1 Tax=Actinomadura luzonensis TaxID=2805427 RepID=A0ABT0FVS3_9ACTN|nr:FKBP-type peptidyl-prolyl cis-trans isomerase [Actinomadura luzonensis]MCK2216412.1 FKBP-type peptidyl-prolyl cis-trans isomerase [Actinomadura luzonensis]
MPVFRVPVLHMPVFLVPVLLVVSLLAAGCTGEAGRGLELTVGGAFGARPTVVFPDGRPGPGLQIDELTTGKGARLEPDDVAIVQYTAHVWDGGRNRLVDSSFTRGAPAAFPVGALLPGLDRALEGRTVGSRVIAAIPPGDGFGPNPPRGVGPSDELFYVVDILGAHHKGDAVQARGGSLAGVRVTAGARPALQVPRTAPPARFAAKVIDRGGGRRTQAGRLVVVQYAGAVWESRRVFDTTWTSGLPKAFKLGDGGVIKAWEQALVGVPAGSRVLMVVPPSYGYGAPGHPAYGVRGSDTLVFVVDVLAAY